MQEESVRGRVELPRRVAAALRNSTVGAQPGGRALARRLQSYLLRHPGPLLYGILHGATYLRVVDHVVDECSLHVVDQINGPSVSRIGAFEGYEAVSGVQSVVIDLVLVVPLD